MGGYSPKKYIPLLGLQPETLTLTGTKFGLKSMPLLLLAQKILKAYILWHNTIPPLSGIRLGKPYPLWRIKLPNIIYLCTFWPWISYCSSIVLTFFDHLIYTSSKAQRRCISIFQTFWKIYILDEVLISWRRPLLPAVCLFCSATPVQRQLDTLWRCS